MSKRYDPGQVTHPLHVAQSAAFVGGASAIPGLATGAIYGTLRTRTPLLFSLFSGAQCFAIGTTFWATRTSLLNHTGLLNWWNITRGAPMHTRDDLTPSSSDKLRASTAAGAFTGLTLGLLFRGPRNVVPGMVMFSLFGFSGQQGYAYLDGRNEVALRELADAKDRGDTQPKDNFVQRFAKSKWSPMSVLSDEEYEEMLRERLLGIEAQIVIVEERIEGVRREEEKKVREGQKGTVEDKP